MSNLYLIAHKVRGEPAFDVAQKFLDANDELYWIIPTSGHRAYPYWSHPLSHLEVTISCTENPIEMSVEMPPDAIDHYSCNDRPARERNPLATALDKLLNFGRKPPADFKRRI